MNPAPGKLRQENYALEAGGLHGEDLPKDLGEMSESGP